jgi:hypothetical protein
MIDFIGVNSGKVVDLEILGKSVGFTDGNYFRSSDSMAVEGVRRIVSRWRADQTLNSKTVAYVNDCDRKTRKLLTKIWPGKREILDLNNITKSFDRKLNRKQKLNGVKEKLRRWFIFLFRTEAPTHGKIKHWRNTLYIFRECTIIVWAILSSKEDPGQWCQLIRPGSILTQPTKPKMKWT